MKKEHTGKIGLRKLTIAKINTISLHKIKGGTSDPPLATIVNEDESVCYEVK